MSILESSHASITTPKTTAMTCGKLGDVPAGKRKVRSAMQKNQLERKGGGQESLPDTGA